MEMVSDAGVELMSFLRILKVSADQANNVHVSTAVIIVCSSSKISDVRPYIRTIKKQGSIMGLLFSLLVVQHYTVVTEMYKISERKPETFVQFHQMHTF